MRKTQAIDVLYLYEYTDRELDVACAVRQLAEERHGLRIQIEQHPYGELLSDLTRFRPRLVALSHWSMPHVPYLIDWPEAVYVNLMWEQLLYKGNFKAKMPRGEFPLNHMIHHAWSDLTASHLRRAGVPAEHIFINGNLTYILYDEPYRRYYDRRDNLARQYGLDQAKRWVFFPENYNWAFYNEAQLQTFVTDEQPLREIQSMRDFCLRSFEEVMRWCRAVAEGGSVEVIVRPRPGTPLKMFREAVQRVLGDLPPHLHIIKGESIREWIIASGIVVSSYSTSLVEAAVAGKPSCIIEPYPIPESIHMGWHDLMPHIRTQPEFESLCARPETYEDDRLSRWARDTMLSRGDPIVSLADFMAQISRGETLRPPVPALEAMSMPPAFNLPLPLLARYHWTFRQYQRFRRKIIKLPIHPNVTHEKELVGQAEVEQRVKRWKSILTEASLEATQLATL